MLLIFFLISILSQSSSLEFKSQDSAIDPGRIVWPKSDWFLHPIEFSFNHAGELVTMLLHISVSTSLQNGLIEIHFPDDFDLSLSEYYSDTSILSVPQTTISKESTITLTLANIQLPYSSGSYGPFGIYTRQASGGQIIDMNKNFCSIGIGQTNLPPPSESLLIEFSDYNMDTVSGKSTISFTFTLTKDLWKYDTFVVTVPSYFSLLNPVCRSETLEDVENFYKTQGIDENTFGCVYEEDKQKLYIYGLAKEIDINLISETSSLLTKFVVTGFTNPIADYEAEVYEWALDIVRFSTSSVIQSFTGSGPETSPGIVSVNSWKPHNSYDSKKIISGLTLFMDLSLTADHFIPSTGHFTIEFTGVDLTTSSWKSDKNQGLTGGTSNYYFVEPYIGGTCTISTTSLTCSGFPSDIVARNTLTISLLVKFQSSSASVKSLVTYYDSTTVIDSAGDYPLIISYGSSVTLASSYLFLFSNDLDTSSTNRVCNTGGGLYYISAYLRFPVAITTAVSINLIFSASTNSPADYVINIGSDMLGKVLTGGSLSTDLTLGTSLTSYSTSSTGITFNLVSGTSANDYISVAFYRDDGLGGPKQLNLPYIASNLWTRYESRVEVSVSNIVYTYSSPMTIIADTPSLSFELLCTDSGKAGLPARIIGSMNFDYTSLYYLYIDIELSGSLSTDLGSGLSNGEEYPFDLDSGSSIPQSATMILTTGTSPILTISSGLVSVLSSNTLSAYFPLGSLSAGSYSAIVSLYYLKKDRSDIHYEIFSVSSTRTTAANTANWQTSTSTSTTMMVGTSIETTYPNGYDLTLRSASTATDTVGYVGLVLPPGFTISDAQITDGSNSMTSLLSFSSTNINFAFPGLFAQETASLSLTKSSDTIIYILGITTAGYYSSSSPQVTIRPYEAINVWNSPCQSITGTLPMITLTRGVLSPTLLPGTVAGRGPGSLQETMEINFSLVHSIPKGGYIEFTIDPEWAVTSNTYFEATGLSPVIFSSSAPYTITGFNTVNAGADITIKVNGLIPPSNTGSTDLNRGSLDYINTYAGTSSQLIDSWIDITDSTSPDTSVTVSPMNSAGKPTYSAVSCFPNTASTNGVSIYIAFTLENYLPIGSTISIKSPTSSWALTGNIKNKCWFSLKYSSCTVATNQLIIVISEEYNGQNLFLLIDEALDTPNLSTGSLAFSMSTTFYAVSIDKDIETTTSQTLITVAPPSNVFTLTGDGVVVTPNNAGEIATYEFTFSISCATVVGYEIWIKFPDNFDSYIGEAYVKFPWGEEDNYDLPCKSTVLGDIRCYVDHWYVIVTNMNTIAAGTKISLSLLQIRNPAVTSKLPNFKFYLLSSSKDIKAIKSDYYSVEIVDPPKSNIIIQSISASDIYLQKTSDYEFTLFLNSITFAQNDGLYIQFPKQFALDRELSSTSLTCESYFIDESDNSVSLLSNPWDTGLTCTYIGYNVISLNVSSLGSWTSTDKIILKLYSLPNPEWGFSRDTFWDAYDTIYFSAYTDWTSQFEIFAYDSNQGTYMGKSYGNLNAGFIGFNHAGMILSMGDFDASNPPDHLLIIPGSQSVDIPIKVIGKKGLMAKKVVFTPKNHYKNEVALEFSSNIDDFFILEGANTIYFRLSVPISASNSLAYIDWTADEYSLIGLTQDAYEKPVKTLVEVYSTSILSLNAISGLSIALSSSSIPIKITADAPPNTNFTLSLSFEDPTLNGIELSPISLTFTKEITEMFFIIIVAEHFTGSLNTIYYVKFDITGENSAIYQKPICGFEVVESLSAGNLEISFEFDDVTENSITIYGTSSITTQVYWQFSAYGTELYSYDELVSLAKPLLNRESSTNLAFSEQKKAFHRQQEIEPGTSETWSEYQLRLYKKNLQTIWYDTNYLVSGQKTLLGKLEFLWASTDYFIGVYAQNNTSEMFNLTISTLEKPQALRLELLFKDLVVESKAYPLTTIVAYNLGIPEKQLYTQKVTNGRRLSSDSTVFAWILTANRASSITPAELYEQVSQQKLEIDVYNSGITNTIISFLASSLEESAYQSPYWTNSGYPSLYNATNSSVLISLKSAVTGSMCCIVENNLTADMDFVVNPTQVYLKLDRINNDTFGLCVDNAATDFSNIIIEIEGLEDDNNYTVTCAAYNTYPLWPTSVPFNDLHSLPQFTFVTLKTEDEVIDQSFGKCLRWELLGIIWILL